MSNRNAALTDECEALNSIYGDGTVEVIHSDDVHEVAVLKPPDQPFSFRISFPAAYPDEPPLIEGTQSTGVGGKGEGETVITILNEALSQVYNEGQVCLFDLIEEAGPILSEHNHGVPEDSTKEVTKQSARSDSVEHLMDAVTPNRASSLPPPAWFVSEPYTVNKSTFVARVCPVQLMADVTNAVSHLLSTNKKVATATHNVKGWRIQAPSASGMVQDYDDDGESAAGGRLLHLMQLMDVTNVLVVVTRWYGGIKLGPDRFRIINNVARDALVQAGFARDDERSKSSGKSKK